jgi:hypothetical protein
MGRDCVQTRWACRTWQMTQKTAFDLHNKTGSDVFIAASTMAG